MQLTKEQKRALKAQRHQGSQINCACVIHSTGYDWVYVERLYNMLRRHLAPDIKFHVYTEHDRSVPPHMIKHCLDPWPGISGPKKSWWYKLQLFNPQHHTGNLLYFDLDTVIIRDVSWITQLDTSCFWGCRDFRYLQHPARGTLNSSVMWWNVSQFAWLWEKFTANDIQHTIRGFQGDQDWLAAELGHGLIRYLDENRIKSWRWQCVDGGFDFKQRRNRTPGSGVDVDGNASVIVFHGTPKPHQITDPLIVQHWQ